MTKPPRGRPILGDEKMEKIIGIKISDELDLKLALAAKRKRIAKSTLVRNIINLWLDSNK